MKKSFRPATKHAEGASNRATSGQRVTQKPGVTPQAMGSPTTKSPTRWERYPPLGPPDPSAKATTAEGTTDLTKTNHSRPDYNSSHGTCDGQMAKDQNRKASQANCRSLPVPQLGHDGIPAQIQSTGFK